MAIMHNTRGYHIPKPYATRGNHYSSLKTAIVAAKNVNRDVVHIMTTSEKVRCKTIATVTNLGDIFEIVIW